MLRTRTFAAAIGAALVSGVVTAPSAQAAPTDCPEAFPTTSTVDGVTGTGYTVERGTTPQPFSATVLGRLTNGIAPGVDMIMADLDSPALTRAGGVWSGMSGSPVYAQDGRLIGSVSYGLAGNTSIAGITPAAEMQKLLATGAATAAGKAKVAVSTTVARRLARTGEVSAAQAAAGFTRLKVPLNVSGATAEHYTRLLDRIQDRAPDTIVRAGGPSISAAAPQSAPSDIGAGGNFAAALSYGDLTLAGIGTTTFVCDGQAVAFGHPFLRGGAVQFSAHPADALFVQPDPLFGPFKVANPGGVVGVVDQDRLAGIRAQLGATPQTFGVNTLLRRNGGPAVPGSTTGVYQPYAADIAALHTLTAADTVFDEIGPGSAAIRIAITGTRADGTPFELKRFDRYASRYDITFTLAFAVLDMLWPLLEQPFEDITITGVSVSGNISTEVKEYRVAAVKVRKNGEYVPHRGVLRVGAGKKVYVQYTLAQYRSTNRPLVPVSITVPAGTKGRAGVLNVAAGRTYDESASPKSFSALLASLANAPTNDSLRLNMSIRKGSRTLKAASTKHVWGDVTGYLRQIEVAVTS